MHKVLITKHLNISQEGLAADYGLDVTQEPFIKVTYAYDTVAVPPSDAWIITSGHAANYISSHFDDFPSSVVPKKIYAVGPATAQNIEHLNIPISYPKYGNSKNLAELILSDKIGRAVYFSGNLRSDTIPDMLSDQVELFEFEVYETELLEKKLDMTAFEAVAFFSPSGVEAFSIQNKITNQKVVAIGTTTKEAVNEYLGIRARIPGKPTTEDVLFALKEDLSE